MKFGNFTTSGQSNMTRYVQLINPAECHWLKCLLATVITKKYVECIPGRQLPLVRGFRRAYKRRGLYPAGQLFRFQILLFYVIMMTPKSSSTRIRYLVLNEDCSLSFCRVWFYLAGQNQGGEGGYRMLASPISLHKALFRTQTNLLSIDLISSANWCSWCRVPQATL